MTKSSASRASGCSRRVYKGRTLTASRIVLALQALSIDTDQLSGMHVLMANSLLRPLAVPTIQVATLFPSLSQTAYTERYFDHTSSDRGDAGAAINALLCQVCGIHGIHVKAAADTALTAATFQHAGNFEFTTPARWTFGSAKSHWIFLSFQARKPAN
eukprot:scaffold139828_cov24-Prasinocladus_malaysianus.AAC.1